MGGDQIHRWLTLSWLQPMEGGPEENMGCDGPAFTGGLPLLPEFSSLSGSETAGSGETLHGMDFERRRILPREVLSLWTQQPLL